MKHITKPLSLALALLMLVSLFTLAPITASAEVSGDYNYEILDDGTAETPTLPTEGTFHVVAGDPRLCNGALWDPSSPCNLMTLGDDGVYRITYENVDADTYHFKVTTNGDWDIADYNLLGDARFGGADAVITVTKSGSKVTITFKESDEYAKAYINDVLIDMDATDENEDIADNAKYEYEVLEDETVLITKCTSNDTSIRIPDKIDDYTVTWIGDGAFWYCKNLERVIIPSTVKEVGRYAFNESSKVSRINVDSDNQYFSSVNGNLYNKKQTELIQYARGKTATSFTIPSSVTNIGDWAFFRCTKLTGVTISNSVTSIGEGAFEGCTSLRSVTIPNSVTSIGDSAFYECTRLTSVTIPSSVTSIGSCAFEDCTRLESVTIPNSVTSIGNEVFSWCENLTRVTIPSSVVLIGDGAFDNCTNLTDVYYTGNKSDWNNISILSGNESLTNATIHFNFTEPTTETTEPTQATEVTTEATEPTTETTEPTQATETEPVETQATEVTTETTEPTTKTTEPTQPTETEPVETQTTQPTTETTEPSESATNPTETTEPVETQATEVTTEATEPTTETTEPTQPTETEPTETKPTTEATCQHSHTKTAGTKQATYFVKGYTGDKVCNDCGEKLSTGKSTPKKVLKTPKVKVKPAKKSIIVKYTKVKDAKGFVVSYKLGKKTFAKTFKTTKSKVVKIKNLKSGKKYTVKVKAYIKSGNKTAYSSWTKAKTVKVK